MALPFRTLKKSNSLQSYIRKQNTAVADIFRNGFFENVSPSVALNSPADAGSTSDTTPTLDFTGTDAEGNDIRFELQLCDENDFYPVAPEILSSSQNSAASGSPNIDAPAGAQAGDKVIVIVTQNGQTTIADNNGSTPFTEDLADYQPNSGNGHTISVFSRTIQAGDPTTYNFTPGVTGRWAAIAIRLKGGEYDVAPSSGNAANEDDADDGTIDAPTITVANNSLHIVVCTWDTASIGTITTPSGYTLIQNANGGGNPLHASSKAFATGGATGAVTCQNTEFGAMIAFSFSVKSRTSLLLDKVSGTDSGFANPDNGGDTDPFTSGENIQYTVQAGDALAVGTYYWRVRGIDPSGSNQWGAWSATRSFEVTSGGSGGTATPSVATMTLSALAATAIGGASIAAAIASAVFSIPTPTPSGGANIVPTVQSVVFSVQSPTPIGGATVLPSVVEASFSVQAPTPSGGGVVTPAVAEATFSAPVASASGGSSGNAEATPGVATFTIAVQEPIVSGGGKAEPSVEAFAISARNPTVSGDATVEAIGSNIIGNGNFDSDTLGSIPSEWVSFGGTIDEKGVSGEWSLAGTKSMKFAHSSLADSGILKQITGLTSGKRYRLSAFVKTNADVDNFALVLDTYQNGLGGAQSSVRYVLSNECGVFSTELVIDVSGVNIFLGLGSFGSNSDGEVFIDDVRLQEVEALSIVVSVPIVIASGAGVALPGIAEVMMSVPGGIAIGGATVSPIVLVAIFEAPASVASGVIIAYPDTAVLTLSALAPSIVIGGATAYPQPAIIGAYKLIYLIESDRYALRITGNMYLEL